MLTNIHTHTVFCDGKSTPEEVVLSAISKGFSSLGFSGHAYMPFDLISSMKDVDGYIREITALKEKYKSQIQIYIGIEEDASFLVDRSKFEYILGSYHFLFDRGEHIPFDISYEAYLRCLDRFDRDPIRMAHAYYKPFCDYIIKRRPDVIGHFDLITKFDEKDVSMFLQNREYSELAKGYIKQAIRAECLFEVNTGAMSRGYRTTPYPSEELLHVLRREGAGIVLTSDSHHRDTLDFAFDEAKHLLKSVGFEYTYALYNGEFVKDSLL